MTVRQVTKNGGALPVESPDGRFLFYLKTQGPVLSSGGGVDSGERSARCGARSMS